MEKSEQLHGNANFSEFNALRQFGLIDLFAMVAIAAVSSALATPFVRAMTTTNRGWLLAMAVAQLAITVGAFAWTIKSRRTVLMQAGQKIGLAYCHKVRWQHGPAMLSTASLLFLAAAQLCFALTATGATNGFQSFFGTWDVRVLLGATTGWMLCRHLWRIYPDSVEFFEHGIVIGGTTFCPWTRVSLSPDEQMFERLVVTLRLPFVGKWRSTKRVYVCDGLREKILNIASEHEAKTFAG